MLGSIKEKITSAISKKPIFTALAMLAGLLAGAINGFLGSGGGIILIYAMSLLLPEQDTKDRFATAVLSILPMSAVSAYFYFRNDCGSFSYAVPYMSAALFGGLFGAWLMTRITPKMLKSVFAVLMIWAGFRALRA